MTALACLRILIESDRAAAGGDELAGLVGKVADAFLATRWRWPRRHGEIAAYAFLLADPRTTRLDMSELCALSEDLHLKLFGDSGAGRVTLAALEGDQDAITRFAAIDPKALRQVLVEGGTLPGLSGRLSEITPEGVRVAAPPAEAGPLMPVTARVAPAADEAIEASFRAVWYSQKESVVGSGLVARRAGSRVFHSLIDGPAEKPSPELMPDFDLACLKAAPRALVGSQGLIFLPIAFSSTIHRGTRESYLPVLEGLPEAERARLAAVVYDVPRAPTFAAVRQLRAFLSPYFSFVDLQTADPAFEIDALMMETVNSVTLSLPDSDEGSRMAAATRFMSRRDAYQRRRIWPAVTNVRTRKELEFCIQLRTPFLSGKAVSETLVAPAEPVRCSLARLPIREAVYLPEAPMRAAR